jgi:capsular polysaccharide biosynthesis protein
VELRRYLSIVRRRIWLIGLAVVVPATVAWSNTDTTPVYAAHTSIYVGASRFSFDDTSDANLSGDRSVGVERLIATFAAMIQSNAVASEALDITGLAGTPQAVVARTAAIPVEGTNILVISVADSDPAVAQRLSIGIAEAFVNQISDLEPGRAVGPGDLPSAPASIFERAQLSTVPQQASAMSNAVTAGLVALVLAMMLTFLAEYLDITVKAADDAERRLELPVLGVIPVLPMDPSATLRQAGRRRREEFTLIADG